MTEAGTTFDLSRLTFSFSRCSTTAVTEASTLMAARLLRTKIRRSSA
jgi:hypothetical protein